jgi:hypothetical protein
MAAHKMNSGEIQPALAVGTAHILKIEQLFSTSTDLEDLGLRLELLDLGPHHFGLFARLGTELDILNGKHTPAESCAHPPR